MAKPPPAIRPTGSQIMIEKFMKDGTTSGRAIAMTLDHYNDQHWYDRDRYHDRIKELETANEKLAALCQSMLDTIADLLDKSQELRDRVAALEARNG